MKNILIVFIFLSRIAFALDDVGIFFNITNRSQTNLQVLGDGYECSGDSPGVQIEPEKSETVCGQYIANLAAKHTGDDHFRICPMQINWNENCRIDNETLPSFFVKNKHIDFDLLKSSNFFRAFDTSFQNGNPQFNQTFGVLENFNLGSYKIAMHDNYSTHFNFYEYPGLSSDNKFFISMMDIFPDFNIYFMDDNKNHPINFQKNYSQFVNLNQIKTPLIAAYGTHFNSNYPIRDQKITLTFDSIYNYHNTEFSFTPSSLTYDKFTNYIGFFPDFRNKLIHVYSSNHFLTYGFYEITETTTTAETKVKDLVFTNGDGNFCSFSNEKLGLEMYHNFGGGFSNSRNYDEDRIALVSINNRNNDLVYNGFFKDRIFKNCDLDFLSPLFKNPDHSNAFQNEITAKENSSISQNISTPINTYSGIYADENSRIYKIKENSYCVYLTLNDFFQENEFKPKDRNYLGIGDYQNIYSSQLKNFKFNGPCQLRYQKVNKFGMTQLLGEGLYFVTIPIHEVFPLCEKITSDFSIESVYYDEKNQGRVTGLLPFEFPVYVTLSTQNFNEYGNFSYQRHDWNGRGIFQTVKIPADQLNKLCLDGSSLVIKKNYEGLNFFVSLNLLERYSP